MSSIKGKNTKPELTLRKLLWQAGLRGYRVHHKINGRPDIAYPTKQVAIFVHGCYWHRCPHCNFPTPTSNSSFWAQKFNKNQERDARKVKELRSLKWKVYTIWECEIKSKSQGAIKRLIKRLKEC